MRNNSCFSLIFEKRAATHSGSEPVILVLYCLYLVYAYGCFLFA